MNLKRSDVMRRLMDAATDGMPNFEGLVEKLDQLDDPAFWAWWQENEKERHMRAMGWKPKDDGSNAWISPHQSAASFQRAWEIFRIDHGMKTALPMLPIMLAFDPTKQEGLVEIMGSPTAWTLWLLWKARHIVSQHFNIECLATAKRIDERQPKTPAELMECFRTFGPATNFLGQDAEKFCQEAVPFFTGEREVEFVINVPRVKHMMIP